MKISFNISHDIYNYGGVFINFSCDHCYKKFNLSSYFYESQINIGTLEDSLKKFVNMINKKTIETALNNNIRAIELYQSLCHCNPNKNKFKKAMEQSARDHIRNEIDEAFREIGLGVYVDLDIKTIDKSKDSVNDNNNEDDDDDDDDDD